MYVRFCDNKGCHAAIPPKRGGVRYWDVQMERKMKMMRQKGLALPDAEQRRLILDYLHRNAYSSEKK